MIDSTAELKSGQKLFRHTSFTAPLQMRGWLVLLGLLNLGLLLGNVPSANLMLDATAIGQGEWWRLLTWPWVHVSRYHLFLDGAAFMLLYDGFRDESATARISFLLASITGSLLLPWLISPELQKIGLCGLSGPSHGLLACTAVRLLANKQRHLGALLLTVLLVKCAWELMTGTALLQELHLGSIGTPIVSTHLGGALGGLLGSLSWYGWKMRRCE